MTPGMHECPYARRSRLGRVYIINLKHRSRCVIVRQHQEGTAHNDIDPEYALHEFREKYSRILMNFKTANEFYFPFKQQNIKLIFIQIATFSQLLYGSYNSAL